MPAEKSSCFKLRIFLFHFHSSPPHNEVSVEPSPDLSCCLLPPRKGSERRCCWNWWRCPLVAPTCLHCCCWSTATLLLLLRLLRLRTLLVPYSLPPIICSSHSTAMKLSQNVAFVPWKKKEDQRNLTSIKHYLDEELDSGPTRKLSNWI